LLVCHLCKLIRKMYDESFNKCFDEFLFMKIATWTVDISK